MDSYIDVALTLSLQVVLHSYGKNPSSGGVSLKDTVEAFRSSVSRYRGEAHVMANGELLKILTAAEYPEGSPFSFNMSPSTPGERENVRRLVHKVKTVREYLKTEIAGRSESAVFEQSGKKKQTEKEREQAVAVSYGGRFVFTPTCGRL